VELSVIIAALNGAATIGEQLEALSTQTTTRRWELVVADNGSRDATLEIVRSYVESVPRLRIVDASDRRGLSYARNAAAAASAGRSLAFCDHDDRVAAGWLEAMAAALEANELVAGRLEHDLLNEPWTIDVRGRPQTDGLLQYADDWPPFAFGCTLGVRLSLHQRLGGFDETLAIGAEDADYCWRAQQLGAELVFAPGAVTHYRLRRNLTAIYRQARNYGESEAQLYAKHRPLGLRRIDHPLRRGARLWVATAAAFARAWSHGRLGVAVWLLGQRVGRLRGSLHFHVALF